MASTSPSPEREQELRQALADLLKEARSRENLTQVELERALAAVLGVDGVAPTTISRYERGDMVPSWGTLDALCEVLSGRKGALAKALTEALRR